ncbi:VolA/Pla-1 family phospholipase [Rheinheimera salexigens]|uniref:Lipase n=1 Tax=Rheinheimera salexigens TaxID=1628148 RepID=A0A1E7Q883_9GAMM|nr:VolA/Pla-1 family phospholipase [Rheinheimera salexigens]OEY70394.1 lipase [Rheinheimera salexigens]
MNKLALSIAVAVALGLTACGDSLQDIKDDAQANPIIPLSRVVFDPGASTPRLSVPNDLLFQGTTDGTLTLDAGDSPDYTNPQVALGALDGWSTQNPFAIDIDFTAGVSLDATSASQPGAVKIFEMLMGDPASSDESCRAVPRGFACKAVGELTFGQDFYTAANGNSVAVIPLKPLKPKTSYMVVLTSVLQDSAGNTIAPSTSYELVKQDFATKPLSTESQRNLQQLINGFENAVAAQGVNKDTIIYTAAMTTQSAGDVLASIKGLMAPSPLNNNTPPVLMASNTGMLVSDIIFPGQTIADTPADPRFMFKLARYYSGTIKLPYYLGEPTEANPLAPLNTRWLARCDSGAIIAALPASMKPETPVSANDAYCQGASGGALRDLTQYDAEGNVTSKLDKARHLTKFNTIPATNSMQTLDVQITVPNTDYPSITMPEAGWPVVILQHGITSKKGDMLAVTGALSSQGFATVAIDHPLHGTRGYSVEVPAADGTTKTVVINASTNSATDYMNLSNLLVTRDNLRQSIADMLGLRLGLNFAQGVDLDMSNVQFLGHSLGAITGTSMVAMANSPTGNPALDGLYNIKTAALAMPGGAIANFLLDSPSFGPLIKSSVMLGAGGATAQSYIDFATVNNGCGKALVPPFAACYPPFVEYLQQTGNTAALTALNTAFTKFAFAAQTVTDAGDPNNYAQRLVVSGTPSYLIEVVGDGVDNLPDQVVPNGFANPLAALQAGKMPLAGTEPLARLLAATAIPDTAGPALLEGNAIARFAAGDHSSILSPATSAAATTEMQKQTVSFFVSQGAAVVVNDASVIAPAN